MSRIVSFISCISDALRFSVCVLPPLFSTFLVRCLAVRPLVSFAKNFPPTHPPETARFSANPTSCMCVSAPSFRRGEGQFSGALGGRRPEQKPSTFVVASAVEGCDRRRRTGAVARESMVEGRGGRRPPCSVQDCIFHFLYIRCSAIFGVCFATTFFDLLGPLPCRQAFGLLCQKFSWLSVPLKRCSRTRPIIVTFSACVALC